MGRKTKMVERQMQPRTPASRAHHGKEQQGNMRPDVPNPTELRERLTPILNAAYREKRAPSRDEMAAIKDATSNPEVVVTIHRESTLPNGKWRYSRRRDAEKIVSLTIWLKTQGTASNTTDAAPVISISEVAKPARKGKTKPEATTESVTALPKEDSSQISTKEPAPIPKAKRLKTATLKEQAATVFTPTTPQTLPATTLETVPPPVPPTTVNSTPTPKSKRETASKNTNTSPALTPSAEGQLSLW